MPPRHLRAGRWQIHADQHYMNYCRMMTPMPQKRACASAVVSEDADTGSSASDLPRECTPIFAFWTNCMDFRDHLDASQLHTGLRQYRCQYTAFLHIEPRRPSHLRCHQAWAPQDSDTMMEAPRRRVWTVSVTAAWFLQALAWIPKPSP